MATAGAEGQEGGGEINIHPTTAQEQVAPTETAAVLQVLAALQAAVAGIAGTQAEQGEALQTQGEALRAVQEVAAEVRAARGSGSEAGSGGVGTPPGSAAGSARPSVRGTIRSVKKKGQARVTTEGERNVLRLFKSQAPFPGSKVIKTEPAGTPAQPVGAGPGGAGGAATAQPGSTPAAPVASGASAHATASAIAAHNEKTARQRKRARAEERKKQKALRADKPDSDTDTDSVYAESAPGDPGVEASALEEARGAGVPYFTEGNDRPARLTNNVGVSLFEPLREAEWFNLFGEGNWKKLGVGAERELEVTYTVEARLLDIELAIGLGVRAEELLPTLAATRQFLQERLDGCLDVLEAGGDARAIKVARVMQEIIREKRQRRKHRSDTHAALFAQADKALAKTTTRRIADMLHWQRFGEAPWTKDGKAPGGGGGGGNPRPRGRAPKGNKAPWVAGSGKGRAAYERDKKAGAPWIGRQRPPAASPPEGAGGGD